MTETSKPCTPSPQAEAEPGAATLLSAAEIEALLDEVFPCRLGRIDALGEHSARLRLSVDDRHLRPGNRVSGPTLMGLADVALYVAILAQIGAQPMAVTSDFNCHFLCAAPGDHDVLAEARLLKLGRRLAVGEVRLMSAADPGQEVAHVTASYALPAERAG